MALVITPLINKCNEKQKPTTKDEVTENEENSKRTNKEYEETTKLDSSKDNQINNNKTYHLQSFRPVELFDGELIFTLSKSIEAINQDIEVKVVHKPSMESNIFKGKYVGDVFTFRIYVLTIISLQKNISTYDVIIKIELLDPEISE